MDFNMPEKSNHKVSILNSPKKLVLIGAGIMAGLLVLGGGYYGYVYASTPSHLKTPTYEHYHFRTQILVNGSAVDFSQDKFQEEANTTSCSAAVGSVPIDFHDKMDQLTHVHWNGMTGGEFLKYFGWNFIGGNDNQLGYRYENMMPQAVSIYGDLLPNIPENAAYYMYAGDNDSYQKKDWEEFLQQDLEDFFGKKSKLGQADSTTRSALDWLIPAAYAHGGEIDEHPSTKTEAELQEINNLIGNVVIFVQENEPTQEQIEARFDDLVPLHESSCGG